MAIGSGTITALNGTVAAPTDGESTVVFNVTGTWSATLSIQGTVDGVNYFSVPGYLLSSQTTASSFTTNQTVSITCSGFLQVQLIATAFTSGTANVAWDVSNGATGNFTLTQSTASSTTVTGTVAATQSGTWTVGLTTESIEIGKVDQGTPNTLANGWPVEMTDGTNIIGTSTHPVRIDPTGTTTQPISGTITANAGTGTFAVSAASLPLPTGASTSADQTNGSQKTQIVDGSGNVIASTSNALNVNVTNTVSVSGTVAVTQSTSPWVTSVSDVTPATQNITVQDTGSTTTSGANSQPIYTGTPTASSFASFAVGSQNSVEVQVTGTWTGTLQSEVSLDGGTTWYKAGGHQKGVSFNSSSFTANFQVETNVAGFTNYRIRAIAAMTGTATVKIVETINEASTYVTNPLSIVDGTGTSNQVQVTAANALKVDGSAVTQPVSGTVTSNQGTAAALSGAWPVNITDGTNILGTSIHPIVIEGPVASGSANSGAPIKNGAIFNTTQPTVTNNEIVDNQATARGALIVATGVDTFNTKDSSDGPVAPGTAATTSLLVAGVYNTTPPAPTNGQQVAIQMTNTGEVVIGTVDDMNSTINITTQDLVTTSTTGANGQLIYTGTPTANSTAAFTLVSDQAMTVEVSGTWTGTLQVEVSMDNGTTWFQRTLHQTGTNFTAASFTANFTGVSNIAGYTNLRVRATAAITGTATVRTNSTANINILYVDSAVKVTDNSGNIATMTAKGTQAGTYVGIQQPKDSGRTYVTFTSDAVAGVTSETLLTMTQNRQGTTTSASTYTITSGKTFRIQSITVGVQSGAGAGEWVRVKLRHNTAGATTTSSALVYTVACGTPQNQAATDGQVSVPIPDGLEFYGDGTQTIGISHISSATTNVESVTICGYEY